jgi:hypothetical protein
MIGRALVIAGVVALGGCAETGGAAPGVATAGIAAAVGSATGNPVIGLFAGLAAAYGVDQGVKYGERRIAETVQDAVANTAGPLDIGKSAEWKVESDVPLLSRSGTAQVARSFGEAIPCKDVVFTAGDDPDLYVTTICQNKAGAWRWAVAEPTVHRWGSLQ